MNWIKLAPFAETKKRIRPGIDLLSRNLAVPVPSALAGFASGFGMGPGVSPPLQSPEESLVFTLFVETEQEGSLAGPSVTTPTDTSAGKGAFISREQALAH